MILENLANLYSSFMSKSANSNNDNKKEINENNNLKNKHLELPNTNSKLKAINNPQIQIMSNVNVNSKNHLAFPSFAFNNLASTSVNANRSSIGQKFQRNGENSNNILNNSGLQSTSSKFRDGKITKRKADKQKTYSNINLLQCFNMTEKEKFQQLISKNYKPPVLTENRNQNDLNNYYQTLVRSSPTKTRDDNSICDKSPSLLKNQQESWNGRLSPIFSAQYNNRIVSKLYTRRISVSSDQTIPSLYTNKPSLNVQQKNLSSPLNNKIKKNQTIIELDITRSCSPVPTSSFENKVAKKRHNTNNPHMNKSNTFYVDESEETSSKSSNQDSSEIKSSVLAKTHYVSTHNENLSENFTLISKSSKLNVNNKNYNQIEQWNNTLNKNAPILQELLMKSQTKSNALLQEEERYKFKKRQRLEKEKLDKELAQNFRQKLHLDANKLAFIEIIDDVVDVEEDEFPELTDEQQTLINLALNPTPQDEVLANAFNISLTRRDIQTLKGLNWLNDEIINFYMNLISERSALSNLQEDSQEKIQKLKKQHVDQPLSKVYAFSTFFYSKLQKDGYDSLKRWTRKVDIFSFDLIIVPLHLGLHWTLAIIDMACKEIRYYDSMNGNNHECLKSLRQYLRDEHANKKNGAQLDISSWNCLHVKDLPQQMNGSDCGMFACKYAEFISRGKTEFSFNQTPDDLGNNKQKAFVNNIIHNSIYHEFF